MAPRRLPALPKLALAAALGVTALATTAASVHTAARPAETHTATGSDWNTMVPEGGHPAQAS
ncbi:hypothetical protein ABH935_001857 [Catenulispora sp. GAS73]|uniref:hypothetical protein n=1 Tax=Catenulispora sp. GAS73 TaxID=3156269 RepID=UPI0035190B42